MWYPGYVESFDPETFICTVVYDDDTKETFDLRKEAVRSLTITQLFNIEF